MVAIVYEVVTRLLSYCSSLQYHRTLKDVPIWGVKVKKINQFVSLKGVMEMVSLL